MQPSVLNLKPMFALQFLVRNWYCLLCAHLWLPNTNSNKCEPLCVYLESNSNHCVPVYIYLEANSDNCVLFRNWIWYMRALLNLFRNWFWWLYKSTWTKYSLFLPIFTLVSKCWKKQKIFIRPPFFLSFHINLRYIAPS